MGSVATTQLFRCSVTAAVDINKWACVPTKHYKTRPQCGVQAVLYSLSPYTTTMPSLPKALLLLFLEWLFFKKHKIAFAGHQTLIPIRVAPCAHAAPCHVYFLVTSAFYSLFAILRK